ncbi:hypothetical protein PBRA_007762 [Plasmodiophora brassicae]|uniref:Reverse transcriptase Ty1/copia-type domain-containing protein n=1 Tax=Plasmodiophora brassicae TaxID=37360 RepID=A0A0G4IXE9_PLABS|nr:hypothetical protein PBRA_007762 [Plasmodiophora brassicae]
MASPEAEFWTKAMADELKSLKQHKTWEAVERLPVGARPIGCRWVYKRKITKSSQIPPDTTWVLRHDPDGVTSYRYKARLCILGYRQRQGIDYTNTYAPVVRSDILRLVLALSVQDKEIIAEQMDVMTAFLNAHLTEEIYMDSPKGMKARTRFVKLLRSIYGLKQAPREWFKVIDAFLVNECGFQRAKSASCLYFKRGPTGRLVIVGVYVDDIPIVGHPELVQETKSALSKRFKMSDMGELQSVIGFDVDRQGGSVFLSQERYTKTILDTYGMAESRPVSTPADANLKLSTSLCPQNQADRELAALEGQRINYRAAVGHLMWLLHTRPDIAYAVNEVSRYVQDPGPAHFVALKRVFRYLNGTRNYGLLFEGGGETATPLLVGYSDSDWGGDLDTRRSTSGCVFLLNGCPVSFRSKKQTTVALSSCEAETVASTLAATEGVWLRNVLDELGFPQAQPTPLHVDNQGAIAFANSEINHSKMKHLALKDHFVRELVASNQIKVHYVRSCENLADIFTKPLGKHKFVEFRAALKCVPHPHMNLDSQVEGGNRDTGATSSPQSALDQQS